MRIIPVQLQEITFPHLPVKDKGFFTILLILLKEDVKIFVAQKCAGKFMVA